MSAMHLPSRRTALQAGVAALVTAAGVASAVAGSSNADAELIRLCEQIVALETKIDVVCAGLWTDEDDKRNQPQLDALLAQRDAVFKKIEFGPSTPAGAKAVAHAYLAVCLKDDRGERLCEDESDWLAAVLAEFVAEREQAT